MATITATRLAYKQTGNVTDTTCLRVVRKDGTVYRFVALDKNVIMTAKNVLGAEESLPFPVTYTAASIADFSAYGNTIGEFGQVDIEGTIEALGFSRSDIINGLFDRSRIYIFSTNYNRPIEDEEPIMSGFWGEVTLIDGRFIAKFSSLIDTLSLTTGRVYQASCDAQLGSFRCGVPLSTVSAWQASASYTASPVTDKRVGSIVKPTVPNSFYYICTTSGTAGVSEPIWNTILGGTTNSGSAVFTTTYAYKHEYTVFNTLSNLTFIVQTPYPDDGPQEVGVFTNGFAEFTSGLNIGIKIPIQKSLEDSPDDCTLTLLFSPPQEVIIGDTVILTLGCIKTKSACTNKFFNSYNYQGFTDVPGRTAFNQGRPTS